MICQDPIFEVEIRAPCGHFYDIGCITDLFQSATRDESLYPPRCCRQNIPLHQVSPHLKKALLTEFELKAQEFGTLKRVYCATPACSRFLGPLYEGFFGKVFTCTSPTCTTATCGKCRGRYEGLNHRCTPDVDTERVLKLSHASGWSRCPGCTQMIELDIGCNHMTCRCKTEFCYLCCALWKTCPCSQWDEDRLLAAAEQRADAQLQPAPRAQPANPPRQVRTWQQLAAGAARNEPVNPPRQTHETAPRPPPVWITRRAILRADVPAFVPQHFQPARHRTEATAPAPPRTWAMVAAANPGDWGATLLKSQRGVTENAGEGRNAANTADDWNTVNTADDWYAARDRMVREIMERLRVDHDCQHTTWKYRYGGGSCEACFGYLPNYLFVSPFHSHCLHRTCILICLSCSGVESVRC